MPEIMSAGKLDAWLFDARKLDEWDGKWELIHNSEERVTTIRSRDSAMLEKYKEAINNSTGKKHIDPGNGAPYLVDIPEWAKLQVCDVLDSAFAEIEGGK